MLLRLEQRLGDESLVLEVLVQLEREVLDPLIPLCGRQGEVTERLAQVVEQLRDAVLVVTK